MGSGGMLCRDPLLTHNSACGPRKKVTAADYLPESRNRIQVPDGRSIGNKSRPRHGLCDVK